MSAADVSALNVQRRLGEIRAGSTGYSESLSLARPIEWQWAAKALDGVADAGQEPLPSIMNPSPDNRWGLFITGTGEFTDVDGTANAAGYDFDSAGITLGADYRVNPKLAVGIMAGYLDVKAHLVDDGRVDVQGFKGGVYATWFDQGFYIDAAAGGGYNFYDTRRGVLDGTARGSTDGTELDGLIGTGFNFQRGRLTAGPTLTLQYTYVGIDGFTETGSRAPLAVQDEDSHSLRTRLGGRLAYDLEAAKVKLRPELRLAWHHEYLDEDRAIDSRLASGAGTIFQVNSPKIGRDSLALSAGLTAEWSPRLWTSLSYDTQLARDNYMVHAVNASLSWSF
jgi:outer membrane autotransporter protein